LALKFLIIKDDLGPVYPYLWGRLRLRLRLSGEVERGGCGVAG
jgi:hypothetical protein